MDPWAALIGCNYCWSNHHKGEMAKLITVWREGECYKTVTGTVLCRIMSHQLHDLLYSRLPHILKVLKTPLSIEWCGPCGSRALLL